jgi:acyl-CoA reductase-like NAD-dependent aldehyde dehydrogenase
MTQRQETSESGIETALRDLDARREDWTRVGMAERAGLLRECLAGVERVAAEWVRRTCEAHRIPATSSWAGEPWLSGPTVAARSLRTVAETLDREANAAPAALTERHGQWVATVTPANLMERLVFKGLHAEVWLEPGAPASQGRIYRDKEPGGASEGGVALVLGAGNVSSIAPCDVVHKLFTQDEVVVLKMHPVNEYVGPLLEQALRPLIEPGYLRIVYGGAETGSTICHDPRVTSLHLTGSDRTYDAIVWGAGPSEQERRKATHDPVIDKRVTAELGCVSPVIVVPGEWSEAELDFQARSVAGMITNNSSFNCIAAKVLLLARGWKQRQRFMQRLRTILASTPQRHAYYPGAHERHAEFVARYPQAELLGPPPADGALPWTLIPEVAAEQGEYALTHEAFCGLMAQLDVEADGAEEFLERAVDLANDRIWGSLSAMLIVDPRTATRLAVRVDDAVRRLRYGGVAVNCWSGYLFALGLTTWGAYPGNTPERIGSGIGTVGNALLYDHPQKSVVYSTFRGWPKPVWFPDHRTLPAVGRRMLDLEASPRWGKLPGLVAAAARG